MCIHIYLYMYVFIHAYIFIYRSLLPIDIFTMSAKGLYDAVKAMGGLMTPELANELKVNRCLYIYTYIYIYIYTYMYV
jgi:hypothetical protein